MYPSKKIMFHSVVVVNGKRWELIIFHSHTDSRFATTSFDIDSRHSSAHTHDIDSVIWLMTSAHWMRKRAAKYDAVDANKLTAPNVFIGYRVSFCRARKRFRVQCAEAITFIFLIFTTTIEWNITSILHTSI